MELTEARGKLVIIGGGEERKDNPRILKKFVELAGNASSKIVILTVATDEVEEVGKEYTKVFKSLGAKNIKVVDVSEREDARLEKSIEAIKKATALFFTGGDQIHITSLLGGSPLQKIILQRYVEGLVIAGTSAGAAMMSNSMIINGANEENPRMREVEIGPGMDLIVGAIIDTHFSQRGRYGRLISAIAHFPQDLGFGIDENTAMLVNKDKFEVIGEGAVTIIDGGAMSYTNAPEAEKGENLALVNVKVHILPEGFKFNLHDRCPIIPKKNRAKRAGNENGQTK